ncbi:DUF4037 domain-containing protein [bacterium]|nr:DUF4037 domain-containing protein [bacterium]
MKNFKKILAEYEKFPQVIAIAIGGSSSAKTSDNFSDIDLYVFTKNDISVQEREKIVKKYSSKYETGGEYFGSGDEFFVDELNVQFDVMYWSKNWFEEITDNVWIKNYPSNGYTTCFLYTLKNFDIIYDPENWLKNLQEKIKTHYPLKLKENIIKRNMMLMKDKPFASYYEQIAKAVKRGDKNSVNHRISAFMASYFDVIFAKNELLHPGEKRLVQYAKTNCKILPKDFEENINKLFSVSDDEKLLIIETMFNNLKSVL